MNNPATTIEKPSASPEVFPSQADKAVFEQIIETNTDPKSGNYRKASLESAENLGLPSRKTEAYKYLRVSAFHPFFSQAIKWKSGTGPNSKQIQELVLPETEKNYLVLVDGVLHQDLSNPGDELKEILQSSETSGNELDETLQPENESDFASSLARALSEKVFELHFPKGKILTNPIQLIYWFTNPAIEAACRLDCHSRISLGENSEAKLIVGFHQPQESINGMINLSSQIDVGVNAKLHYTQVDERHEKTALFGKVDFSLKRDASVNSVLLHHGSELSRFHHNAFLNDTGAEALFSAICVLDSKRQSHHYLQIHHNAPNTLSSQHFKFILTGKSQSSFDGTINVAQQAQQIQAYQLVNNLMLSNDARANTKPNLQIFADDVKASHGATIGQLDADQLYYLTTRGLNQADARAILTAAFANEVVEKIPFEGGRKLFRSTLLRKLKEGA